MHFQGMILFQLVGIGVGNMISLRVPFGVGIAENGQREVGAFVESANANFRYGSGEKDGTQGTALGKSNVLDFCDGIGNDDGRQRGAVVEQRVHPHIHHVAGIKVHGNTPAEAGAADAQVLQAGLDEVVDHLVDAGAGLQEVRILSLIHI